MPLVEHAPPELLTVRQTAAMLAICVRRVWQLAKTRRLVPVRIGTSTRWRRADILAYIDQLATASDKEASR